jgi:energy-coupling factor transport system ATP-binding protein
MYKLTPFKFSFIKTKENPNPKILFSKEVIEINKNGIYLVSGNSGSGKSTFLNLLKGIAPNFIYGKLEGEIKYNNLNLFEHGFEKLKTDIVYLFQNPFSQLIHQNLELEFAFTLENLNCSKEIYLEQKEKLTKYFELGDIWTRPSFNLSNGECQKLVLASLVAISPKVLLLDEPTAFLDLSSRAEFYKLLGELKKEHIIIIVDHHLEEISSFVDLIFHVSDEGELTKATSLIFPNFEKKKIGEIVSFEKNEDSIKINVDNLNFRYFGQVPLFINASFSAKQGDVVVIRAKNGMGKSTLLKILSNTEIPDKGSVSISINNLKLNKREIRKHLALVFQNSETNFFHDSLIQECKNVKVNLTNLFFAETELLRSPFLLSEGQKRRASILINLVPGKKIFFIDEPTFGQDVASKELIIELVNQLKVANYLQIIISHDDDFIKKVATKVYTIKDFTINETKIF